MRHIAVFWLLLACVPCLLVAKVRVYYNSFENKAIILSPWQKVEALQGEEKVTLEMALLSEWTDGQEGFLHIRIQILKIPTPSGFGEGKHFIKDPDFKKDLIKMSLENEKKPVVGKNPPSKLMRETYQVDLSLDELKALIDAFETNKKEIEIRLVNQEEEEITLYWKDEKTLRDMFWIVKSIRP